MFDVKPGAVINLTSFTHYTPTLQVGFKPPKGMVAVFMLLGNADKKNPDSFDCEQALRRLGWAPMHEDILAALEDLRTTQLCLREFTASEIADIQRRADYLIAKAKGGAA